MELLILEGDESIQTWQDALRASGKALYLAGMVRSDFAQACIEREKRYPTGLPSEEPVAIPHADGEYVENNALCFLRLRHPVRFQRMDDPKEHIDTKLVINMAISKNGNQVKVLQKLIEIVKSKKEVKHCLNCSGEQLKEYVQNKLMIE